MKGWNSPFYAFFNEPTIEHINKRTTHTFACAAIGCKYKCRRYLDTKDAMSTGNMACHVKSCWGENVWVQAKTLSTKADAMNLIKKRTEGRNRSITAFFQRVGKGSVTFSHRQLNNDETRTEIVR